MKKTNASLAALLSCIFLLSSFKTHTMQTDNWLTDKEKNEGWQLLFNGNDMSGWRTYQNKPGSWRVTDGAFNCRKIDGDTYSDLITEKQYENFELAIDWKMEPKANSGIMYMVKEDNEHSFQSGPEYQVVDDIGFPSKLEDYQKTGADYAMYAPTLNAFKAAGEWNHTLIVKKGAHVEHWLNGKKVVEYELWSDDWKKRKEHSKWKDEASYGAAKIGHIALQDYHGEGMVWYKNIKIKELK